MHLHETAEEITGSLEAHGKRPFDRLAELGLLSPALLAVHMTQLTEEEIGRSAEVGLSVLHCPRSNLKLASGFCPVARLLEAGINVALGTDGAASNNDLDMVGECRTAALIGKAVAGDASAVPAHAALRMATVNGARALGLESEIGTLEPDKWADITCIDLGRVNTQPVFDPASHIVYAAGREQVTDVWVGGRHLLAAGRLSRMSETDIISRAEEWQARIAPASRNSAASS